MDDRLKQRLVGAVVLVVAAVVFVPWILDSNEEPARIVPAPQPQPRAPVEPPPQDSGARVMPLDDNAPAVSQAAAPAQSPPAAAAPPPAPKAPPEAPAKAEAKAKPAATSGYAVQLGSFSKAANARGLRDRLVAKGYTAFVRSEGSVTRVYVGPQKSRAEADAMKKKLLEKAELKGFVVKL